MQCRDLLAHAFIFGLGLLVLLIRRIKAPAFFATTPPERADLMRSPFVLDFEKPPPGGGIVVDCNDEVRTIRRMLDERLAPDLDRTTPLYLVFGIEPGDISGDEYSAVRDALEDDGARITGEIRKGLRARGMTEVYRIYDDSHAEQSVEHVAEALHASAVWSSHRMSALD